jgi:hypothetical protein
MTIDLERKMQKNTRKRNEETGLYEATARPYGPLAAKQIQVRLPEEVDAIVRNLPNSAEWLRTAIIEAAKAEGLVTSSRR